MSITVILDPETEKTIEVRATSLGMSMSEYVARIAKRSARATSQRRNKKTASEPVASNVKKHSRDIISLGSADYFAARGITLPDNPGKTGAELLSELRSAGLLRGYGDPSIDSRELARMLREQAQTRDWS